MLTSHINVVPSHYGATTSDGTEEIVVSKIALLKFILKFCVWLFPVLTIMNENLGRVDFNLINQPTNEGTGQTSYNLCVWSCKVKLLSLYEGGTMLKGVQKE